MALSLRDRVRAGMGNMTEWLADRDDDITRAKAEIDASARRFYDGASRGVRQMLGPNPGGPSPGAAAASRSAASTSRRPSPPPPKGGSTRSRDDQILENARRLAGQAQAAIKQVTNSEPVRKAAGETGRIAGNIAGLVTGGAKLAKDAADGAIFVARLLDPYDSMRHPLGDSAANQVLAAGDHVVKQVVKAAKDPEGAKGKVVRAVGQAQRDLDPNATPAAPTLAGEVRRNFAVGKNQGELLAEGAGWVLGAAELKAAARIRGLSRADLVAKYVNQGFSPADAAYLAEPYKGMGHHSAIRRSKATLPKWMGGGPVPKSVLDGPFNVLAPPGISRGDMYELHYKVDRHFTNAPLPRGGRWVGSKLGLKEYDRPARIWYGTPTATKRAAAGAGMVGPVPGDDQEP